MKRSFLIKKKKRTIDKIFVIKLFFIYLILIVFNNLEKLNAKDINFNILKEIYEYKNELKDIIKPWNIFLIILENTWENRPNWGFFWSFWVLKIHKTWYDIKIKDVYETKYIKDIKIEIPDYLKKFWERNSIDFISPRIYWFTDLDWKNIKYLYENIYNEKITWIIFIKSRLFENINEEYKKLIYKWQFINASIDLIRWKNLSNKKEIYLNEINSFIKNNKNKIINDLLKNINLIYENIEIYLPWYKINNLFRKYWMILEKKKNCIYIMHYNLAFNKLDRFVEKDYFIYQNWKFLFHTNKNYFCLINNKNIEIKWIYKLNIPKDYINYINELENLYNIKLTEREKHILLKPYIKNNIWIRFNENFYIINYELTWWIFSFNLKLK